MEGLVTKSTGSWYAVRMHNGDYWQCRVRGKLRMKDLKVTNPVAVGDRVRVEPESPGEGNIAEVLPRENYLIRRSIKKSKHGHILAANIDQAVLIATPAFPRTSLGFIDRFLVAAESFRIGQVLAYNKSDLWNQETQEVVNDIQQIYEPLGVQFVALSAETGLGVEAFTALLKDKISLLAGHSGVGKSTILNRIAPGVAQKTSEVSTFANKGTHTTTFAEMFEISPQTFVIDTPGIKELGLMDIYEEEISHFFPEMRDMFGECRFHNCTHTHEPGCAVVAAVEKGEIALSRYESYLSMVYEEETHR